MMENFVLLFLLGCGIEGVHGQIGSTGCTFATQAVCPATHTNSYCNLDDSTCQCAENANYIEDEAGTACIYDCKTLAAPAFGSVDTTGGTYVGDIATYSCQTGYKVNGQTISTCVQDGGWDNTVTTCIPGVLGDDCSSDTQLCSNIANAMCDNTDVCACTPGYENDGSGTACTEIDECVTLTPCQNGGTCTDAVNTYSCACVPGYEGTNCETDTDECASTPCQNGGDCTDEVNKYTCSCAAGYDGTNCDNNIDECVSNPCLNGGTCADLVNGYTCACVAGYEDTHCETNINECVSNPCQNGGTCVDGVNGYICNCKAGYEDTHCTTNIDECVGNACENGATCVDGINSYTCTCDAGYEGGFCADNIDDCLVHVCLNGATCNDGIDAYTCLCVTGYDGDFCENDIDDCSPNPCQFSAVCIDEVNDYTCNCVAGYTDKNCQTNINECAANPCMNSGTCVDAVNDYACNCVAGYTDKNCQTDINECESNNCQNGATCVDDLNGYTCICVPGYDGDFCINDVDDCVGHQCQNGGLCIDGINDYTCDCILGYSGTFCQNDINECTGHACLNGATCVDGINEYTCTCVDGYAAEFCQTNIDECSGNACENGATCVDGINLYTCTCVDGYSGLKCETNIDDCSPDPCFNGGTCVDAVFDYSCNCMAGYTDKNCQTNIDECDPDPCQNGAMCGDLVYDYSCTCLDGYDGKTCAIDIDECSSNPCQNEGTCTDNVNRYTCACVAGYNGIECQNNIDECVGNLCVNGATCVDAIAAYTCTCVPGYDGTSCENDIDECLTHVCLNGATCIDEVNTYSCLCVSGFTDDYCETNINECASSPCDNGGTCTDMVNEYVCACANGYTGLTCTPGELGDDCSVRDVVCDNLAFAECDGSVCVCITGYDDPASTGSCDRVDCLAIAPPVDGAVDDDSEGTLFESKAYFTCDDGYTLTGLSFVTCQADTNWDGATPTCIIKNCGSLQSPMNGGLAFSPNMEYLSQAVFTCDEGYTQIGDAFRVCQAIGVWGGSSPTCEINDCGELIAPTHGTVDHTDGTTYLSLVTFQCEDGYTLVGVGSLVCQSDSSWDGVKPSCNIKDCGSVTDPSFGAVDRSLGTEFEAVAYFSCFTGYTLVGSSSRICQASGVWSSVDPICQINDCDVLLDPTNGDVDILDGTTFGQIAKYSCDQGFELNGVVERTCQSDETWSTSAPTCDRLDCGNLNDPTYGTVDLSSGTLFEAIATFECDPGYTLTGDKTRECTYLGDWDKASPTCIIKDCGSLEDPENGQVLTSFGTLYNKPAEYSCNMGYQVNGEASHTCTADGVWSAIPPTCGILDCGPVADIVDGLITYSLGTIYGSTVSFACNDGYEVTGVQSRICQASGTWSDSQPICTILSCDDATVISNGVSKTPSGTQVGDLAIYECESGYGLVGDPNVSCEPSGFWGTVPECRQDCGTPEAISNGVVTYPDGTLIGDTSQYACNDGYYISGDITTECLTTGSWTTEPFCFIILAEYDDSCTVSDQCVSKGASCRDNGAGADKCLCSLTGQFYDASIDECLADCGGLSAPTNGLISLPTYYSAGQIAVYSCLRGYSLTSSGTRTCLSSGVWNGSAPQCAAGCPEPDPPANGVVDTARGLASGDTITYSCNTDYALVGAAERRCNSDSQWSGSEPTCNIECPLLTHIEHGWVDLALGRWEGSKAVYVCENNYAVVSESTRTCQSSGLWDGVEPECVFAIFPDVLLVFGSLFVFLVLIDIFILAFCLYIKYFQKRDKEVEFDDIRKKDDYPEVLDEEEETGVPPPAFLLASQERKTKKEKEKFERRNKPAKVAPEQRREILRMDQHPPPKKGPNVRVERNPFLGLEKPKFLKNIGSRRKTPRGDRDLGHDISETDRSKTEEAPFTPIQTSAPPPNTVQQQAMKELREDTTHSFNIEEFLKDGGYGTANSDESNHRIVDDDQLSLDDLTPPQRFPQVTSHTPKEAKRPGEDFNEMFRGRVPLPTVTDTQVTMEKEVGEKLYTDRERKLLKNTVNTYSQK